MAAVRRRLEGWTSVTTDAVLSVVALAVVWLPATVAVNPLLGTPLEADLVVGVAFALAIGTTYPSLARDWTVADLADFVLLLFVAGVGWGIVALTIVAASGVTFSGSDLLPQAAVWLPAYATAYAVTTRTTLIPSVA